MHFVSHWFFTQILFRQFVSVSTFQNIYIQPPLPLLSFGSEGYSIVQLSVVVFVFFFNNEAVNVTLAGIFCDCHVGTQKFFLVNMLREIWGVGDSSRLWLIFYLSASVFYEKENCSCHWTVVILWSSGGQLVCTIIWLEISKNIFFPAPKQLLNHFLLVLCGNCSMKLSRTCIWPKSVCSIHSLPSCPILHLRVTL